jgi:hypothetical protein
LVLRPWHIINAPLRLLLLAFVLSYLADVGPRGGSCANQGLTSPEGLLLPDMQMSTFQLALCLVHLARAHSRLAVQRYLPGALELLTRRAMWDTLLLKLRCFICLFHIFIRSFHLSLLVLSDLSREFTLLLINIREAFFLLVYEVQSVALSAILGVTSLQLL